jgi:uncharacterized protein YndB with AHSA1/START domain
MVRVSVSRFVRAAPQRVFDLMVDLRGATRVVPAIQALEVLDEGPVRVGTRFRETRVVFGREHTETLEVTELDPPRRYAVGCTSHGARYDTRFTLQPRDGGTQIVMEFEGRPLTLVARILAVLTAPLTRKMVAECAKDLDAVALAAERAG